MSLSDHMPQNNCVFKDLEPGEHLRLVVRKHWIVLLQTFVYLVILIAICVGITVLGQMAEIGSIWVMLTAIGLGMFGLQYIFIQWVNNELDILLLTNERLLVYEQVHFLDRKLSQASLGQIQEVTASTSGLLGNLIHYGNLMIQTAGEASNFHLTEVPEAIETSRVIHNLIGEYSRNN
jgi:hypothetical protein